MTDKTTTITYRMILSIGREVSITTDEIQNAYGFDPVGMSVDEMLGKMAALDEDGDPHMLVESILSDENHKFGLKYSEGGFYI